VSWSRWVSGCSSASALRLNDGTGLIDLVHPGTWREANGQFIAVDGRQVLHNRGFTVLPRRSLDD